MVLVQASRFANHRSVAWQWRWRGDNRLEGISEVGKGGPGDWADGDAIDQNRNEEALFALFMIWGRRRLDKPLDILVGNI